MCPVGGGSIGETFPLLLTDLGILAIGLAVYGAVFALIGALVPRPLVAGLLLVFGWEQVALLVPGYLRRFTIAHYLQSLGAACDAAGRHSDRHSVALLDASFGLCRALCRWRPSRWLPYGWPRGPSRRREYVLDQ